MFFPGSAPALGSSELKRAHMRRGKETEKKGGKEITNSIFYTRDSKLENLVEGSEDVTKTVIRRETL